MTAFLLDQSIQDATEIALNNQISAIVCPYSDNSDLIEKKLQALTDVVAEFEKRTNKLMTKGRKVRAQLSEIFATAELNEQMFDDFNKFIEQIEVVAHSATQAFSKSAEFVKSFQSEMARSNPKFSDRFQKQFVRLRSAQSALLDEYSEMSLFSRALRAKYNPQEQLSEPFANKHDLERYLDNLIA